MSWPKRDGSYSFLRHLGPFGCIKTAIFSENANLSKTQFLENLDSTVSTGQLEQKITLFAIFQDVSCGQLSWKIVKNQSHLAKFGCGNGAILVILFKKMWYIFQTSVKKIKKLKKNIFKIINIILSTYTLIYVSPKNFIFLEKSDVSKIWSGQKAGEDANETKVHDEAKKQHQS